jgi:hypothetical protein
LFCSPLKNIARHGTWSFSANLKNIARHGTWSFSANLKNIARHGTWSFSANLKNIARHPGLSRLSDESQKYSPTPDLAAGAMILKNMESQKYSPTPDSCACVDRVRLAPSCTHYPPFQGCGRGKLRGTVEFACLRAHSMLFHCGFSSFLRSNGRRVQGFGLALARHSWREVSRESHSPPSIRFVLSALSPITHTVLFVVCWAERGLVNARRETFVLASLYALC